MGGLSCFSKCWDLQQQSIHVPSRDNDKRLLRIVLIVFLTLSTNLSNCHNHVTVFPLIIIISLHDTSHRSMWCQKWQCHNQSRSPLSSAIHTSVEIPHPVSSSILSFQDFPLYCPPSTVSWRITFEQVTWHITCQCQNKPRFGCFTTDKTSSWCLHMAWIYHLSSNDNGLVLSIPHTYNEAFIHLCLFISNTFPGKVVTCFE